MKRAPILLLVLLLAGCHRGMEHQPSRRPFTASPFFPDGNASRPEVADTVAVEEGVLSEAVRAGRTKGLLVPAIPVRVTSDLLARGREQYGIFCAVCTARTAQGTASSSAEVSLRPPPSTTIA